MPVKLFSFCIHASSTDPSVWQTTRVLTDPFRFIAGNHIDQADEIQRVLPVDDEKGCRLAVEI